MTDDKTSRNYESPRRQAQAEQTRQRILEATLAVLARGASAFTVPAVAKEAGVSLPTVYRLFPNKTALAKAARLEVRDRLGIDPSPTSSLDELIQRQATHVHNAAQMDEAFVKALFELSAQPLSKAAADAARQAAADALKTELQGVRGKEREYLLNAVSMFFSSAGAVMLWRYRLMNDEGTETFAWVIRTLVDAVKKKKAQE